MSPVRPSDDLVWKKALELDEIEEGRVKSVTLDGITLCMTHWDGQYGALDNRCPHQGGPLGKGCLQGKLVTCPWHGWQFDVSTGEHEANRVLCHRRWDVKVEGDGVFVRATERDSNAS